MQRYLTNNFSQSESFQPLERMHFNNLIQPLDFFNHWACQKYAKKFNRLKFCSNHWKFQPLKLAKILAIVIVFTLWKCNFWNIGGAVFWPPSDGINKLRNLCLLYFTYIFLCTWHRYLINRIDQTSRSHCFEATGPMQSRLVR